MDVQKLIAPRDTRQRRVRSRLFPRRQILFTRRVSKGNLLSQTIIVAAKLDSGGRCDGNIIDRELRGLGSGFSLCLSHCVCRSRPTLRLSVPTSTWLM
jgi:hypothetical protein